MLETVHQRSWNRQSLRVSSEDNTLLSIPALPVALELVRENIDVFQHAEANLQGRTLQQLRKWSRQQVLTAASEYTSLLTGEDISVEQAETILTGGHQPALFHAGVWAKNFAIGELAERSGGVAVNLVIDNDTFTSSQIRVPVGCSSQPTIEHIPFDIEHSTEPWEEARILDRKLFDDFGSSVSAKMQPWGIKPLINEIWPDAIHVADHSSSLRDSLTAARCRLERRWGISNLELPISHLCNLDSFRWFASHLLAQLPQFHTVYNDVLKQYRQVNRIRSRMHPVPDLAENDGWLEAPFWVWQAGDIQRKRLFAKQSGREVHLSDGTEVLAKLPLSPDMEACCAVEVLRELAEQGLRLRTRALTTTLFSRLCFSDLFVHGIGGSKYDEMTDHIITRFFGIPAPRFLTLSATLHLPLAKNKVVGESDIPRLINQLRDLEYNSDRYVKPSTEADRLIAEKTTLIAQQRTARTDGSTRKQRRERIRENYERFQKFQDVNGRLSMLTADERAGLEKELHSARENQAAAAVLQNREYSFCLYPAEKIRPFMTGLWDR